MTKIIHVFYDQDMRCRHDGLAERARKERGFDVHKLKEGDVLMFINSNRNRIIALAGLDEENGHGVMGYYRSPRGTIDEMAIQFIPQAFSGGGFKMNNAIKQALHKRLAAKHKNIADTKPPKKAPKSEGASVNV